MMCGSSRVLAMVARHLGCSYGKMGRVMSLWFVLKWSAGAILSKTNWRSMPQSLTVELHVWREVGVGVISRLPWLWRYLQPRQV